MSPTAKDPTIMLFVYPHEIYGWLRTENPDWLDPVARDDIRTKLARDDPYVWSDTIVVAKIGEEFYILDGHHRLSVVVEPTCGYNGTIGAVVIPEDRLPPGRSAELIGGHFGPLRSD